MIINITKNKQSSLNLKVYLFIYFRNKIYNNKKKYLLGRHCPIYVIFSLYNKQIFTLLKREESETKNSQG